MSLQGDKNSIVQSAAIYIHELKVARDQLQRRNDELKAQIMGHDEQQPCVTVQFEVDEPSSSIDSMIAALRRLKGMSVKARGIRSSMSGNRLWTEMNVETTVRALSLPWLAILENFCIFFPSELSLPALLTVTVRVLIRLGKMQQFVSYKISLIFVFYQYTVSCLG